MQLLTRTPVIKILLAIISIFHSLLKSIKIRNSHGGNSPMLEFIEQIFYLKFFQNRILDYSIFLLIFVTGILIIKIIKNIILKQIILWTDRTGTTVDDFLIETIQKMAIPLLYYMSFFISTQSLLLSANLKKGIHVFGIIFLTFYGIRLLSRLIDYFMGEFWQTREEDAKRTPVPRGIITITKAIAWVFGSIFLLDNLGFKISTVVAGLGIGGVAVALAAQTVLKDLFNYFVIIFDRPFVVGDFIVMEDYKGTVEKIGIKTTRLRSIGGEQLIVANTDLTDSTIQNFKRMKRRTVTFTIGVSCETPLKQLKTIPKIIEKIINSQEKTKFERTHLRSLGDFTYDFEVLFYVTTTDYKKCLDIKQDIYFELIKEFGKRGIELPFPTQTVMVKKS